MRIISLIALVLIAAPDSAKALRILQVSRDTQFYTTYSDWDGHWVYDGDAASGPALGAWTSDLRGGYYDQVRASQDSFISEQELRATGDVRHWTSGDLAESHFYVLFDLDAASAYEFSVDNFNTNGCCRWQPTGSVTLDRYTDEGSESIHSVVLRREDGPSGGAGDPDFSAQGILAPGRYGLEYRIEIRGSSNAAGPARSGFELLFVPEPSTALLFALGLVALAARRQK